MLRFDSQQFEKYRAPSWIPLCGALKSQTIMAFGCMKWCISVATLSPMEPEQTFSLIATFGL